jgi:hypothetical protein
MMSRWSLEEVMGKIFLRHLSLEEVMTWGD